MKQPRVQPTRQQLQAAFSRLQRPGWPTDLDTALADRAFWVLIHGLARNLARQALVQEHMPHRPAQRAGLQVHRIPRPPAFDARRAAANDLDE